VSFLDLISLPDTVRPCHIRIDHETRIKKQKSLIGAFW